MSRFVLSLLVAAAMSVSATSACGQAATIPGRMEVKEGLFTDGAKIMYEGRTYRPAGAAALCQSCSEARDHFLRAKRLRVRSFLLANLGIFEVSVGATQFDDVRVVGTAHALVGGIFMTWAAAREAKVRREVRAGVDAYNRCQFHLLY
jgi:hypothetical protein